MQELIDKLDARGAWDIWRTALGEFAIRLPCGETFTGKLADALREAVDFSPLPIVPREPRAYLAAEFTAKKSGSKWQLYHDYNFICGNLPTKRAALETAARFERESRAARDVWAGRYAGWLIGKTEGVDFRWSP